MIGCLWTRVHKKPIIALYFESETVLKSYNLEASSNMDLVATKPVFGVSDKVRFKPACSATGTS